MTLFIQASRWLLCVVAVGLCLLGIAFTGNLWGLAIAALAIALVALVRRPGVRITWLDRAEILFPLSWLGALAYMVFEIPVALDAGLFLATFCVIIWASLSPAPQTSLEAMRQRTAERKEVTAGK